MSGRRFIGATDLGACVRYYRPDLAHFSPYSTAADLWMRLVHDVERPATAAMKRGLDAEPRLRQAYLDAYGGQFRDVERPWRVMHSRLPFVGCSPDDVWSPNAGMDEVYCEWKSSNWFTLYPPAGRAPTKWGEPETDAIPPGYQLQVQLNLECLDLQTAHLFVGFGTDEVDAPDVPAYEPASEDAPVILKPKRFLYRETRRYVIQRDPELMALALEYAERFHKEHVATRMPPSCEPEDNIRAWKRLMKEQPWKTETAQS